MKIRNRNVASILPILVLAILFFCSVTHASIPLSERDALIALYNNNNGFAWRSSEGWLGPEGTECSWFGVICDGSQSTVVELKLNKNELVPG